MLWRFLWLIDRVPPIPFVKFVQTNYLWYKILKIALNSGLIIVNPWTHNKLVTCREKLSTPVKEQ